MIPLALSTFSPTKWIIMTIGVLVILTVIIAPYAVLYFNFQKMSKENANLIESKNKIESENSSLKSNVLTLKANVASLQEVNKQNQVTIEKLLAERQDSKKAIENLAQKTASDKASIEMMSARIKELLSDPKNNGELAPVLRETINNVQKMRKQ